MEERILTRHPEKGKQGGRISKAKYSTVRDAILESVSSYGEITFDDLIDEVNRKLQGHFDGSISWYVTTVKLDLEARRVIRRVPQSSPQRLQLVTRQ